MWRRLGVLLVAGAAIGMLNGNTGLSQGIERREMRQEARRMEGQPPVRLPGERREMFRLEEESTVGKRFIETYDANRDGRVTREEYPGTEGMFKALDKNGDGVVTQEDLKELTMKMESEQAQENPIPMTEAFDKNGDGLLSRDEWPTFEQALEALDKNKDGVLSPAELAGVQPGIERPRRMPPAEFRPAPERRMEEPPPAEGPPDRR